MERATVWIDSVKRGPIVIEVRGLGTLVPEDIVWIPAKFDSQVAKLFKRSGDEVKPNDVLMVLTNPDMEVAANDFEWQVKGAEATLAGLKVQLQSTTFDQQSMVETTQKRSGASQADHGSRSGALETEPQSRYGRPDFQG